MKKLLAVVGGALIMGACSDSPTAPVQKKAPARPVRDEITCRSGYVIAYDENGNPYCKPDGSNGSSPSP